MITELIYLTGTAHPVNIAARLGVRPPTATKALLDLAHHGLFTHAKHRSVPLTDESRTLTHKCHSRHAVVLRFRHRLSLDAKGIEHHVSGRTLALFAGQARKS